MAGKLWWPFLAGVFILGIMTRVYLLAGFGIVLAIFSAISIWWNRVALDDVVYERFFKYTRGFPGEDLAVRLEIANLKFLPLSWLKVTDRWPKAVSPENRELLNPTQYDDIGELTNLYSLRWFERNRRSYQLSLQKRGIYKVGPARLESGDLFGFFSKSAELSEQITLTVFPKLLPIEVLQLPAEDPFGERRAKRRLFEDPNLIQGVRDYHPEDEFRRVHWPATAHTGNLQVKVFQPVTARVLIVCLNVTTFPFIWEGTDPVLLEYLVSVAATLISKGLMEGYQVGLLSNGCLANSDRPFRVLPGRSRDQYSQLLITLAGVTPFFTGPFDRLLISEAPRLPYGACLVIVTGFITPGLIEAVYRLKQHNRRIILFNFGKEPTPEIGGVTIYNQPYYSKPV